jgi:hypothetical protein
MTLFEFLQLEPPDQIAILYEQGVYIGKRKLDGRPALLYQVESFYVEVFYLAYRKHVLKVRASASTAILDPYLEQIDVVSLVS